ncbi:serine/threonine protein kinase [Sulfurifustis variabilis]|uniref:non-specific serine/threonine protein kinase n=1 Tax=Sulfurifustis variabilis TaxID=1675686 RepID=A0A1C7AFA8_9GAMM|nr:RIO1 family regulatory kinase/ATPase [Sulfurifustis variabilis]BAU49965.1 serine/threonine protein kinase [Sulfurifustis variabilis]
MDAGDEAELVRRIEERLRAGSPAHSGYQGEIHVLEYHGRRLAVKVAAGFGPLAWLGRLTLRREARAYENLRGFAGSPACLGLLRGRYLVLDYVEGVPLRRAKDFDRAAYFETLLAYVKELHARGVAHADLKRKDNLLVVEGRRPCLIDFGAAIVRKPGFAPINHLLYGLARQFDYNAWVKLKHRRRIDQAPPEDLGYYRRTRTEKLAGAVKAVWLALKSAVRARS